MPDSEIPVPARPESRSSPFVARSAGTGSDRRRSEQLDRQPTQFGKIAVKALYRDEVAGET